MVAGNLSNTWVFDPGDSSTHKETRCQFDEQIKYQIEYGPDFFIAETLEYLGESKIALEAIKAADMPSMITMGFKADDKTLDGILLEDVFKVLEDSGADIVGINCFRDPKLMLPLAKRLKKAVSCFVATQPVAYRCSVDKPYFQMGINYIGACCGTAPHHLRAMAEALGRVVPNSKYSPALELHTIIGDEGHIKEKNARILCEQRYGKAHCHFLAQNEE
jgi:betaine-homocysteine S-methyltransferase